MKVSKLLYDSLSIDYINRVFENQEYIKENDKNLNISPGELDSVSHNKFKNIYHRKIVDFLNMHITTPSENNAKPFKADQRGLGLLSTIPDIAKLNTKVIPGINKKIEVFNVKNLVQGVTALDLNKFLKKQLFSFFLKDKNETIVGAKNSNDKESLYVITIPPVYTEIREENIVDHMGIFSKAELFTIGGVKCYKEYSIENVSFKTCSESDDHVALFQAALAGRIPILSWSKRLETFQIANRGTTDEKIDSED